MTSSASLAETTTGEEILVVGGKATAFPARRIAGQTFIESGRLLRTATLRDDWREDLQDPERAITEFRQLPNPPDLLRFWQRLPDCQPRFGYYRESVEIAAIPVTTYARWWESQINGKTRNMVRKGQKAGVVFRELPFDDDLVRGIMGIFNESPVRRGKRFWHYRKTFATVKWEMGLDLAESIFIGAHHANQLIGFIKLLLTDRYAMVTMILDKISEREKAVTNGMIAKAVETCATRSIPFLTYTHWRRGEHGEFQKRNGFEKHPVPRYFVPLTRRGQLALRLRLHNGLADRLPAPLVDRFLELRRRFYARRLAQG